MGRGGLRLDTLPAPEEMVELSSLEPEPDEETKRRDSETRFLADVMLGSLARWLRILGYDTAYDNGMGDDDIVGLALKEGRIVLTRDRRLCLRRALRDRHVLIESERLDAQLSQVLVFLGRGVPPSIPLSRCVRCNGRLAPSPPSEVRDQVPPYVWKTQPQFKRCLGCGRVYWHGTHRERTLEKLRRLGEEQSERTRPGAEGPG